ncbi:MAG: hypothetical protein EOO11_13940 [Chitinophagaceae bacterium]|nr:MAG: hypothetical protein EOO11_13940 [Chitinophagaceae bacterium]
MSRLMVVSNRLPYAVERNGEDITVRQSSGGLVSAVKSYFEKQGGSGPQFDQKMWVGSVDTAPEDWQEAVRRNALPPDMVIEPVFPDRETYDLYYNGFANGTIWPLFHYFPSITQFRKEHFAAYEAVNRQFAERILGLYEPGDVIWVAASTVMKRVVLLILR